MSDDNLPAKETPFEKRLRGWRPNSARPMTDNRKALFLAKLAEHGIVGEACKRASLHSNNGCIASFYRERDNDEEFAAAWDEALDIASSSVEAELHRRGVRGYDEPVWWQGKEVGSVRKFSDALLLARIRKLDPDYRTKQSIEHSGAVDTKPLGLENLTDDKRDLLRRLLSDEGSPSIPVITFEPVVEQVVELDHESGSPISTTDKGIDEDDPSNESR